MLPVNRRRSRATRGGDTRWPRPPSSVSVMERRPLPERRDKYGAAHRKLGWSLNENEPSRVPRMAGTVTGTMWFRASCTLESSQSSMWKREASMGSPLPTLKSFESGSFASDGGAPSCENAIHEPRPGHMVTSGQLPPAQSPRASDERKASGLVYWGSLCAASFSCLVLFCALLSLL